MIGQVPLTDMQHPPSQRISERERMDRLWYAADPVHNCVHACISGMMSRMDGISEAIAAEAVAIDPVAAAMHRGAAVAALVDDVVHRGQ